MKRQIFLLIYIILQLVDYGICQQNRPPEYSHTRGFYTEPFYLILTADPTSPNIRFTSDCSKPDKNRGTLYTEPIYISHMTTIRSVAYSDSSECSEVRTHSFIFPKDVLKQDDSGVPIELHSKDHVYWTEKFDMTDATQSEEEMIDALMDLPTVFVSAPYESIFGIAGIHRGQNLEEFGGDPQDPNWIEEVECSVEWIYPTNYRNGQFKNWQENCGIKIQGGASRWYNGSFDHKQSFTLEFKGIYGSGMLKNDFLVSAPFNRESGPKEFDKIILRTGFNRDWGSTWDPANYAYTRDQFARDLQTLMSGWGNHGTYAHLYINGKYWGQYNPCERTDNNALATYFGGVSEDYFYGKGKDGMRFGSPDRYSYLTNTDWTNRQFNEIEEYLAVDTYIDCAIIHGYGNVGDGAQYYYGGRTNPPGPIYYTAWDMEDSFDGGARRTGPPVSLENLNYLYSADKFKAYFQMKKNIDFKMKFADRIYKHCFNDGILTDQNVIAIWDSSCKVIEKSILCEIARWMDERIVDNGGAVYDYNHWKNECKDVKDDLIGRGQKFVSEVKKSGMYPNIDAPSFQDGSQLITTSTFNCPVSFSLTISMLSPPGSIFYTTDGSDPRLWDLTGNVSATAIEVQGASTTIPITQITTIKTRIKNENTWSPLHELKIIPQKTWQVVINEINYNPSLSFNTEDWIELYNNGDNDVDISGWMFKDSDDAHSFVIPQGTILDPNAYLVLCVDTTLFKPLFPDVQNFIGNVSFGLSGSGELIRLYDDQMHIMDSLVYDDNTPWPTQPDGNGPTLSLKNPDLDNTLGENWAASIGFGTPGKINDAFVNVSDQKSNVPTEYELYQNYPNPFNPSTEIRFQLPQKDHVNISVFNILGQRLATLVNEEFDVGTYHIDFDAGNITSGIYFYSIKTNNFSQVKKMILLK